ncbi:MAG: NAD-dependent epimerase/dehydratase family protein [Phaeodactylibacter sp.]|uniref:NAD-dependent epimerase/dehydratase family protein n=1 Tax=Phaeodactylibacter sp. TaxID=1940289 RepID=UPI0032EDA4E0
MRVLVTGADGMLGSNIVRVLLEQGYQVCALLLPNNAAPTLKGLPIEKRFGNILDAGVIRSVVAGCEAVIHAAALTDVWPNRSPLVRKVNLDGTCNIIEAALYHRVQRFIYIGSGSSFAPGSRHAPGDENSPFNGNQYGLDYIDSKYLAQRAVLRAVQERSLPALVLAPTFMLGPYDSKPGAGKMILAIRSGKLPFYTPGGRNFVHVRDVAVAAVNALTKGRIGECYLAGNTNLTYPEAFAMIAEVTGTAAPRIKAPATLVKFAGLLGSAHAKLTNKPPVLSYAMARIGCNLQCFNCEKAVRELEMPQTPIRKAIRESFAWLRANGYTH